MANETTGSISALFGAVHRIEQLSRLNTTGPYTQARNLPQEREFRAKQIVVQTSAYGAEIKAEDRALAARLKDQLIEEAKREGEIERDRRLSAYARELESLRAALPAMAAKAAIEAGLIARHLAYIAENPPHE